LGPFNFWAINNKMNSVNGAIDNLLNKETCKNYYNTPFIKFVGSMRSKYAAHKDKDNLKYYINKTEDL
jgi:hypothetical protein